MTSARDGGAFLTSRDRGPFRKLPSNVLVRIFQYYLPPIDGSFVDEFPIEFRALYRYRANLYRKTATPVFDAIENCEPLGVIQILIDEGYHLDNYILPLFDNPLNLAVSLGRLDIVKALIKGGAALTTSENSDTSALIIAAVQSDLSMFDYLLESGADINERGRMDSTALIAASFHHSAQMLIPVLLSRGADINCFNFDCKTALMKASEGGVYSTVRTLLDAGANVNDVDWQGHTAFMLSSGDDSHLGIGEILLKFGSKVNAIDRYGRTALMMASFRGGLEWVKFLLKNGAEFATLDFSDRSALYMAVFANRARVIEYLLQEGASLGYLIRAAVVELISTSSREIKEILRRYGELPSTRQPCCP